MAGIARGGVLDAPGNRGDLRQRRPGRAARAARGGAVGLAGSVHPHRVGSVHEPVQQHDHRAGAGGGPQLQVVALVEGDIDRLGVDARVEHLDDRVLGGGVGGLVGAPAATAAMMVASSPPDPTV